MYTFTKSAVLQENPEDFIYYTPHNQYTTQYYDTNFTNERDGKLLISLDNVSRSAGIWCSWAATKRSPT